MMTVSKVLIEGIYRTGRNYIRLAAVDEEIYDLIYIDFLLCYVLFIEYSR